MGREKRHMGHCGVAGERADNHSNISCVPLFQTSTGPVRISVAGFHFFVFLSGPLLSLPPCINPSLWRLILLNIQTKCQQGCNMINYTCRPSLPCHTDISPHHLHFADTMCFFFFFFSPPQSYEKCSPALRAWLFTATQIHPSFPAHKSFFLL